MYMYMYSVGSAPSWSISAIYISNKTYGVDPAGGWLSSSTVVEGQTLLSL